MIKFPVDAFAQRNSFHL